MAEFPPSLKARYVPLEILGRGAFGVVVRARDRELDREVAVKLLVGAHADRDLTRFTREGRALARLDHPNVLRVFDTGVADGLPYLVTELLRGHPADEGAVADPARVMADAAEGLAAIHAHGLVHRDVKPANLFVTTEGRGVLLDLGLVRDPTATAATKTGAVVGTLRYLAPELFRGAVAGPASDWFAWGATLYELGEGAPLRGEDVGQLMAGRGFGPPRFSALDPDGPVAAAVRATVELDPGVREGDGAKLAALLRGEGGVVIARRPASSPPGTGPPAADPVHGDRDPRGRWGLALALGVGVAGVVAWRLFASAPPPVALPGDPDRGLGSEGRARLLAGFRELPRVAEDPRDFPGQLRGTPGMARVLELLETQGVAGFSPEDRTSLRLVDEALVERGGIPLFGPLLGARPLPGTTATARWVHGRGLVDPRGYTGWMGRVVVEMEVVNDELRAAQRSILEGDLPPELLQDPAARTVLGALRQTDPWAIVAAATSPGARERMRTWVRPQVGAYRTSLVAMFRAFGEGGDGRPSDVLLISEAMGRGLLAFLSELHDLPLPLILGGLPRTPGQAFVAGQVEFLQNLVQARSLGDRNRFLDTIPGHLRAARAEVPPGSLGNPMEQHAAATLLEFYSRIGDLGELRDLVRELVPAFTDPAQAGGWIGRLAFQLPRCALDLYRQDHLPRASLAALHLALGSWVEEGGLEQVPASPKKRNIESVRESLARALAE